MEVGAVGADVGETVGAVGAGVGDGVGGPTKVQLQLIFPALAVTFNPETKAVVDGL